jgi:hypothetical protein
LNFVFQLSSQEKSNVEARSLRSRRDVSGYVTANAFHAEKNRASGGRQAQWQLELRYYDGWNIVYLRNGWRRRARKDSPTVVVAGLVGEGHIEITVTAKK